jgi:hypothetical protein
MSLSDIASRQPVLDAVAEQLGRDQFLQKYGFGHSRSYWLIHNGQRYDSKAITGAAPGYVRPDLGPLGAVHKSVCSHSHRSELAVLSGRLQSILMDTKSATIRSVSVDSWE